MGLNDIAKADLLKITTNLNDFGVNISLIAPDDTEADIVGYDTKHHTSFDLDSGVMVNARVASISFSLGQLTDYPHINEHGNIDFSGHKVNVDSEDYLVREYYPDLKLNTVVLILQEWQAS